MSYAPGSQNSPVSYVPGSRKTWPAENPEQSQVPGSQNSPVSYAPGSRDSPGSYVPGIRFLFFWTFKPMLHPLKQHSFKKLINFSIYYTNTA